MDEKITSLRLNHRIPALIFSFLCAVGILLPYASIGGKSINMLKLFEAGSIAQALSIVTVVSIFSGTVLAVICQFTPNNKLLILQTVLNAVSAATLSLMLFASKSIIDNASFFDSKMMVKNLGIGYWMMLIGSYVALIMSMKILRVHTGYIVLIWLSIIWLFPIAWIVITAFRGEGGYYVGYFIPRKFTLDNFTDLFKKGAVVPFAKWWWNTFIVAACSCVLSTLMILMTSYVLSRLRFSWRLNLMKIMLVIGMFPGFMSMIAVYNILKGLGLSQNLGALVIVNVAGAAMGYYICKGFLDTIPKSLDEAAIIDGATRFQIFTKIIVPLSKPIIIYTILTSFIGPWGDYIFPSMLLGDKQSSYTVAIGLKWMTDFRRIDSYYTRFAAGAVLVSIPIVILFVALQRFYVEGLSGSVKG